MTSLLLTNTRPFYGTHSGFGFLARVNTVSAEKLYACTALLVRNSRPPEDTGCVIYTVCNIRALKVNMWRHSLLHCIDMILCITILVSVLPCVVPVVLPWLWKQSRFPLVGCQYIYIYICHWASRGMRGFLWTLGIEGCQRACEGIHACPASIVFC